MLLSKKNLNSQKKEVDNCRNKCHKDIFEKNKSMIKKRMNCSLKKQKKGINYKKCLKQEGIDLNKNFKDYSKCTKTKCKKKEKEYKNSTKKKIEELKNKKKKGKCCKCCVGRYWGNSLPCIQNIYPCCKGVSSCKK